MIGGAQEWTVGFRRSFTKGLVPPEHARSNGVACWNLQLMIRICMIYWRFELGSLQILIICNNSLQAVPLVLLCSRQVKYLGKLLPNTTDHSYPPRTDSGPALSVFWADPATP